MRGERVIELEVESKNNKAGRAGIKSNGNLDLAGTYYDHGIIITASM